MAKFPDLLLNEGYMARKSVMSHECHRISSTLHPTTVKCLHLMRVMVLKKISTKELLHHADQDSQYTSEPFQWLMEGTGVTCSMS